MDLGKGPRVSRRSARQPTNTRRLEATFRRVKMSEKGYEKVNRALASTIDIP